MESRVQGSGTIGAQTEAAGALAPAPSHAPHGAAPQWGASGMPGTGLPTWPEHTRRPLLPRSQAGLSRCVPAGARGHLPGALGN